eukprot:gene19225-19109_t
MLVSYALAGAIVLCLVWMSGPLVRTPVIWLMPLWLLAVAFVAWKRRRHLPWIAPQAILLLVPVIEWLSQRGCEPGLYCMGH